MGTVQDFSEGAVDDPVAEAIDILQSIAKVVEEGIISNVVHSLRFCGNTFSLCSLSKHFWS